jgi:hypothetical protein
MQRLFFLSLIATSIGCSTAPSEPSNLETELASLDQLEARKVADHESGHVLWALLHPELFTLVSVEVSNYGGIHVGATQVVSRIHPGDPREKIIVYLAHQFAGKAADRILGGEYPMSSVDDDAQAYRRATELLASGEKLNKALAEAERLAERELAKHRNELNRLSKALQEHKFLSGAEAARIWKQ